MELTEAEVAAAAGKLQHKVDEFTGDELVTYEVPISAYTTDPAGNRGTLAGQIQRKEGGDWRFHFAGSYVGEEWLFYESVNIRSKSHNLNCEIERVNKVEKVLGGGLVVEIGSTWLGVEQAIDLLSIVQEGDVKFRFNGSGSGAGTNFTGVLGPKMTKNLSHVLKAFIGTQQGFNVF
jgi:hypothetical protein